ncbi:RNA polymerase sigma factor [Micromonospora sp. WMMD723]|uniref:RNA polymerase sigma factor n=1 Tax=unclassified Micromonospora TaxID=2617518 RepID=UPI003B945EFA
MGADQHEHETFTRSFASSYHLVLRYCYRRVGDMELAQELTQETFVVAWRRRHAEPSQPLPWLYGIARRVLADQWRARRSRPATVPMAGVDVPSEGGEFEAVGLAHDLQRAFARLSEPDREVLRLVTWEELDVSAAAQVLGCSRTAAAVRLFRARQRLARLMNVGAPSTAPKALTPARGGIR